MGLSLKKFARLFIKRLTSKLVRNCRFTSRLWLVGATLLLTYVLINVYLWTLISTLTTQKTLKTATHLESAGREIIYTTVIESTNRKFKIVVPEIHVADNLANELIEEENFQEMRREELANEHMHNQRLSIPLRKQRVNVPVKTVAKLRRKVPKLIGSTGKPLFDLWASDKKVLCEGLIVIYGKILNIFHDITLHRDLVSSKAKSNEALKESIRKQDSDETVNCTSMSHATPQRD